MSLYDELKEQLDGHPYKDYFSCFCPFEEHEKAAMLVWEDGKFNCLSCHKAGNLEYLAKYINSGTINLQQHPKQVLVLPKWKRWQEQFGDLQGIANFAHRNLLAYPENQWYFKKRKIEQFIEQGYFGQIENWSLFPVLDQHHKVIDIVVRDTRPNSKTKYVISPSQERKLYVPNWERVLKSDTVFVVYGIVDVWSFEEIGYPCVTGLTGKSLPSYLLKELNKYGSKHFIIIPDKSEEYEARKLVNELGWDGSLCLLPYPEDTKDPDSIRTKIGTQAFENLFITQLVEQSLSF